MRLVNCEHPTYIRSPYTGEMVTCACGKCNSCLNSRAKKWIDRLDLESQQHKYCYMFTLTYDDEHLPCLFLSDDMESLVFNRPGSPCIPLSELYDLMHDEYGEYLEDDITYLRDRLLHPLGLPVCYPKDVSDFFKRLNKYLFKHVTHHYENFRYFCCHEYGPSTYRCHVHGLLWFDEDVIAQRIGDAVSSCWSLGYTDLSAVFSNGGKSYVAQYVNMSSHLPSFYKHRLLRQKTQFSRFPSIGSFQSVASEIREVFDTVPVRRTVWSTTSARYVDVSVSDAFARRFFPKLQGYSELSYFDRVGLYGAVKSLASTTFQEFHQSLHDIEWLEYRHLANVDEKVIFSYSSYLYLTCSSDDAYLGALKRWYSISKRIVYFSNVTCYPVDKIVRCIDEFYSKQDYHRLVEFYKFQENYVQKYPLSDLVCAYPTFYRELDYFKGCLKLPDYVRYALDSFGINLFTDKLPDYRTTNDFLSMVQFSEKIFKDTHKRHAANAYRDGLLVQSDPVLSRILSKYQIQKSKEFYG